MAQPDGSWQGASVLLSLEEWGYSESASNSSSMGKCAKRGLGA